MIRARPLSGTARDSAARRFGTMRRLAPPSDPQHTRVDAPDDGQHPGEPQEAASVRRAAEAATDPHSERPGQLGDRLHRGGGPVARAFWRARPPGTRPAVHPVRILVRPRHLQPGLPDRFETGRFRLRERRGLRMALERRVRRDLLHGAAPDWPAPGAGAVRLPRAAGVELGAPGRHRLALLPRPRPACPADRHELDLRRRAGRRRVDRRAVARPDVDQLVDELLRQPLVRGNRDPLPARPADGQCRDRRGRLAHRPRRCGRGARVGLRCSARPRPCGCWGWPTRSSTTLSRAPSSSRSRRAASRS